MKKREKRKLKVDYMFVENKPQLELAFRCLVENFYKNQRKLSEKGSGAFLPKHI